MITPDSFSLSLRSERERRGISLDAIADSTKIRRAFLVALETGDLAKMPPGIFRRGIVYAYAQAVGLQAEWVVADLARLTPEQGEPGRPQRTGGMRLTLAPEPFWKTTAGSRALAAAVDAAVILLTGIAVAQLSGASTWAAAGAVAFVYSVVGTLRFGQSPATWLLTGGWRGGQADGSAESITAFKPDWWADLVRRSATVPVELVESTLDPPAEPASAHSHAVRP